MLLGAELKKRSESKYERCSATDDLSVYQVPPKPEASIDNRVLLCQNGVQQIEHPEDIDVNHGRCLNDSMWTRLKAEG